MHITSVPLSTTGVASFSSTLNLYNEGMSSLGTWQITREIQISNNG